MTNAGPPLQPLPAQSLPHPSSFGWLMGNVEPKEREPLMKEIAAAVVDDDLRIKIDAAIEALGFVQPDPLTRFNTYATWDDNRWGEAFAKFPKDAQKSWDDYMALLERAQNGTLV